MAHNLRDIDVTLTCSWCGTSFHPWKRRENDTDNKSPKYCSRACRLHGTAAQLNTRSDTVPYPLPVREAAVILQSVNDNTENGHDENGYNENDIDEIGANWRESGEHWDKVALWYAERQDVERRKAAQKDTAYTAASGEGRTITLAGFGTRLTVKQDHLIIQHGRTHSTQDIPQEILYRGIHGVSTIVWLTNGGSGLLSVAALKWCASQNITVRMLTHRGEHLATIHPSPDAPQALGIPNQENGRSDIKLRRAQYALQITGKDIPLARLIILRKLAAQQECLQLHPELPDRERGLEALNVAIQWLSLEPPTPATSNLDGIRLYEARASNGYFMAWRGLPLQIDEKANKYWPQEWKTIGERKSPLTRWMSPRQATNPAQAMLNFCYAMLESQIRAALNAIGADSTCGVLHADRDARDSLVYDVMEPLRGDIDHLLLEFIKTHTFGISDFNTQSSGAITIHPALCKVLAEMVRLAQRKADDEARWYKKYLLGNG